jgi:hypothetical protein
MIPSADLENIVVVLIKHVPKIVLGNFVPMMATALESVVVVILVLMQENVLDLVLENRVNIMANVDLNIVVVLLIKHVP